MQARSWSLPYGTLPLLCVGYVNDSFSTPFLLLLFLFPADQMPQSATLPPTGQGWERGYINRQGHEHL